jgi:hypothetical protein
MATSLTPSNAAAQLRKEITLDGEPLESFSRPAGWQAWNDSKGFLTWLALANHRHDLLPQINELKD